MRPHDNRILYKLLHAVDQPVSVRARFEAAAPVHRIVGVGEVGPRFRNGALVRDGEHSHPAAQDAQRVHCVERLRAAVHLGNRQGPALRWTDAACGKRDPVNLVLEDGRLLQAVCQLLDSRLTGGLREGIQGCRAALGSPRRGHHSTC